MHPAALTVATVLLALAGVQATCPLPMTVGVQPMIIVYVDDVPRGSHDVLRSMSTDDVESIERLDAASATQRFGTGHEHGAIVIRRRSAN
jgi:hypothetical protein